jgi:hypothetical protein
MNPKQAAACGIPRVGLRGSFGGGWGSGNGAVAARRDKRSTNLASGKAAGLGEGNKLGASRKEGG